MIKEKRISIATYNRRRALLRSIAASETDECIEWPYPLVLEGPENRILAIGVVCEMKHGPRKWSSQPVQKICANPKCFNPRHMEWAMQQRVVPVNATITEIRALRREGLLVLDIAQKLNMSVDAVQQKMDAHRMRYL